MYAGEIIEIGLAEDIFEAEDHHPYTVGLFGSIPDLSKKERRLHPIDGMMPDPSDLPSGCKFHTRCPYATDRCRQEAPVLQEVEKGHKAACHRALELA